MKTISNFKYPISVFLLLCSVVHAQQVSIVNSKHNLSASGTGAIRATSEQEVCIFCHTPHNASPVQPLWNRSMPANAYTVYSSTSLQAHPGQPTGSSKLCLSCHDGTIAVGSVLSRQQPIAMAGGITTLPPGHGNLGTDLSDDHPISFRYDVALSGQDPKIKSPTALPPAIKLDGNQELQCTSCHDAHNDAFGQFLVMDNTNSQLCNSCHQHPSTTIVAHAECAACHQMHTAPSGALLLKGVNSSEMCLTCHSSQTGLSQGINIAADMDKVSRHQSPADAPMTREQQDLTAATCAKCHEPHSMQSATASAPLISPMLGKVSGVSAGGGEIPVAQYQYEVCYKCHQQLTPNTRLISRQIIQANVRLEFASSAVSYHPVEVAGKNVDVPSLRLGMTSATMIYCSDCHGSETSKAAGGNGPNGPHGSNAAPILAGRYDTLDNSPESAAAYALCYKCHDRTSILNDESFSVHRLHIQDQATPCSICHDAHGISSTQGSASRNSHLINFDTTAVQPDPTTGRLEYKTIGPRTGQCTLSCHGSVHTDLSYPGGLIPGQGVPAGLRKAPLRTPTPTRRMR